MAELHQDPELASLDVDGVRELVGPGRVPTVEVDPPPRLVDG